MQIDIFCFSHLRWDFVYQRPQHLLSRFSMHHRVFYIEEPLFDAPVDYYNLRKVPDVNVWVVVPHLVAPRSPDEVIERQRVMIDYIIDISEAGEYITWYYTPMALPFTDHLDPKAVVYDCMDELSGFKFAPPELVALEAELMQMADVMFTGGNSLYQVKKLRHGNIYSFPSSIDKAHFITARQTLKDPEDQASIGHPRLGFFGVIDERFDRELIRQAALARPDLQFVFIGPVVKIDPLDLPRAENIHYLGGKAYADLPQYLAGWDIAIMPFAMNESTTFISPTKTPEYLCGGKQVISTPIADVVNDYGKEGLVYIGRNAEEFVRAADEILQSGDNERWLQRVDTRLANNSWSITWEQMYALMMSTLDKNQQGRKNIAKK